MDQGPRVGFGMPGGPGAARFVQGFYRKPSLGGRILGMLLLIVISVPLLLLILTVAVVSAVVFVVAAMWTACTGALGSRRPPGGPPRPGQDNSGRRNVRIRQ
ncbi:MAG: hypothetical protein MK074_07295 [Phycisphaerales bacterium]|nr:hypothetical protein [Phycisphaerales bacterium]